MAKLFISHSSKDKKLVDKLIILCTSIGIKPDEIFCSSFEGQGIKNGKRINSEIKKEFDTAECVLYVITTNFIGSTYCTQELGAYFFANIEKAIFIFKSNDVQNDELEGFIDKTYKYSVFDTGGLSSFCEWLNEKFEVTNKITLLNKAISSFLETAKKDIEILVEDKDKTTKEIEKKQVQNLEKQYYSLPLGAKKIIGEIYFSYDGVGYYSLSNGTVGLLHNQLFIIRTTTISSGFMQFAYALQPWAKSFIDKNKKVQEELKTILKTNKLPSPREPDALY